MFVVDMRQGQAIVTLGLGVATLLGACKGGERQHFIAEGIIEGAEGQTLYLEEIGRGSLISLDSVRIDNKGYFHISREGTHYPMFYRLRLREEHIHFAADSSSYLSLRGRVGTLSSGYQLVEAEPYNHQIRDISFGQQRLCRTIDSLSQCHRDNRVEDSIATEVVSTTIKNYKRELSRRYIYSDPKSPAAYFALYQELYGNSCFSVYEAGDERAYATVATAFEAHYPGAPYTAFLRETAKEAIAMHKVRCRKKQAPAQ